jgi:hypothetical protein
MAQTYFEKDVEEIIDDIIDALKNATTGINAWIDAINTRKAVVDAARARTVMVMDKFKTSDGAEGLTENQNLYFFMVEEEPNFSPFMIVSIPTWTTDEMGASILTVQFNIVVEDSADNTSPKRKLLRYLAALRKVLNTYLNTAEMINAARASNVEPDLQRVLVDGVEKSFYSAGVKLELSFA